jgi:hypothetical protein
MLCASLEEIAVDGASTILDRLFKETTVLYNEPDQAVGQGLIVLQALSGWFSGLSPVLNFRAPNTEGFPDSGFSLTQAFLDLPSLPNLGISRNGIYHCQIAICNKSMECKRNMWDYVTKT